ncbi:MAG: flagellar motor protein MotB [Lacunisphaera sp.]|nr:flagellar motor protein MotB [Lacunisphaera sp.]
MAGHGGAWKVAYADFVTAMMALFMVLWISAQDQKILIATSRYFQSPFSSMMNDHSGIMPFNKESNSSAAPKDETDTSAKAGSSDRGRQIELNFLNSVAADVYRLLHLDENVEKKSVDVQVTSDGLRLTLFDRTETPLFVGDTTDFSERGRHLLQNLAWLIDRHKFRVTIDGHTRLLPAPLRENYSAWELSSDRANAARRALVYYAVEAAQIERVTGYADTRPLDGAQPDADANQRITLSLTLTSKLPTTKPANQPVAGGTARSNPSPRPDTPGRPGPT